jgi:hypothetical protein
VSVRVLGAGVVAPAPGMFPAATRTPDGIVVAFSTVPDGWPGGEVHVTRSSDGGVTWTSPVAVARPGEGEDAVLGAVGLARTPGGDLLLPCNSVTWTPGMGTEGRRLRLRLLRSSDDGATWTGGEPVDVGFAWPAVYGEIVAHDGELLWPIWGRREDPERWRSALLASADDGRTWSLRGTIAYDPDARLRGEYVESGNTARADDPDEILGPDFRPHDATDGFTETSVVPLADGRLLAVLRQQGVGGDQTLRFFRAHSSDGGATWTPYEDLGFTGMSPALHRLPDGRLVLASRRCAPEGSGIEPATEVRVGAPDGLAWGDPVALAHPSGLVPTAEYQTGYPAIVDAVGGSGDELFVVFYTFDPASGRFIAWNRISVSSDGTGILPE